MSRLDKLMKRFLSRPRDFSWDELVVLLASLGYVEKKKGKTGGSRRRFVHESAPPISLHKPHPANIVKRYAIDEVITFLEREKLI